MYKYIYINLTSEVIAANDITAVFLTLPLIFYLNKKNKAFWCGLGQLVAALANLLPVLAWLAVPGSYVSSEIRAGEAELCGGAGPGEPECGDSEQARDWGKLAALACFFLCKLCSGVAQQAYWTIGLAYMDDNVTNTSAPAVLGICYMAGYAGGFAGKMLGSACLSFTSGELGAWWLGWPVITVVHSTLAILFILLPAQIRDKECSTEAEMKQFSDKSNADRKAIGLFRELWNDLKRLANNRILIFDSLAMSFFLFASTNRSYTSKFVEFQFLTSPSAASLFSGSSSMVGMMTALAISIVVISIFKPPARILAGFNFIADIFAVIIGIGFIFVDCDHMGISQTDSCFSDCACSTSYKPVCDLSSSSTFFSACAAGCGSFNGTSFTDCSCSPSSRYCPSSFNL